MLSLCFTLSSLGSTRLVSSSQFILSNSINKKKTQRDSSEHEQTQELLEFLIMAPPNQSKSLLLLSFLTTILLFLSSSSNNKVVNSLKNGLAKTPPMGWLAWERFTCETNCVDNPDTCINKQLFMNMADILHYKGYSAAGYKYVNIDDCWSERERDPTTNQLVPALDRFGGKEGMIDLANNIHNHGLLLGIYGNCGLKTCAGYPAQLKTINKDNLEASENYFDVDAESFNEWQIDSFKFDGCYIDPLDAESICPKMAQALKSKRRDILLICEWPFYMMYAHAEANYTIASESCNVWRYYDDIEDSWSSILNTIDYSVKHQSTIVKYHGPGHWFDPDQLVIGNFGLSFEQERTQMAIWAIWSAPLYMSNDLRHIRKESSDILLNKHLIKVNQDPLGVWGQMVLENRDGSHQAFVKPIEPIINNCPSFAIVYLNRNSLGDRAKVSFKLRDLLLGAPIYQAAKSEQQLLASSSSETTKRIKPGECLNRLKNAMLNYNSSGDVASTSSSSSSNWPNSFRSIENKKMEYKIQDLFEEALPNNIKSIAINDMLELIVNPNGVRALRLEEMV